VARPFHALVAQRAGLRTGDASTGHRSRLVHLFAAVLTALIFLVDLQVPVGSAIGMLYLPVILLGLWSDWRPFPVVAFSAATALLAVDTWVGWDTGMTSVASVNRPLLVALFAITARVVTTYMRLEREKQSQVVQLADIKRAIDHAAIVATTDVSGRITYVNDKFCEISGYSRDELLGQDHRIVNSAYHAKEFIRDLWRTIAAGRVWHGELRNRTKDGRIYWVDTTIVPFLNEQAKPYQYIAIRADITARKSAEERLMQQAALAQVGQMAAVVAHEVRNPLAGIKGAMQVLMSRRTPADDELPVMRDIVARIDSLSELINDLMIYARPRPLRLGPTDLRRVVNDAVIAARRDPACGAVEISVEGDELPATADEELIRAAVLNLVLNGAQAMGGRGSLAIALRYRDGRGVIEVRDTGPGIPPGIRDRVFEPFFTTKSRGGGLGLPIARRTAELHGGSISLVCPEGGGTVVTLDLPVAGPPAIETASPADRALQRA
jgi:PAS domain S-box-containing protein